MSAAITSKITQDNIESRLEKRQRTSYGPKNNKSSLLILLDDVHLPRKDFGSQPCLELMRQILDYKGWYDRMTQVYKTLVDINTIATMTKSSVSSRFISKFHAIHYTFPSDDQVYFNKFY